MAKIALIGLLAWTLAVADDAQAPVPGYIAQPHRAVIREWLAANKGYRVATDTDCTCGEHVAAVRSGTGGLAAEPGFHPYYAAGDFNGDGHDDFAVIFVQVDKPKKLLAIFNGPFVAGRKAKPAYSSRKYALSLSYGPPRPKPYLLVAGRFEAEEVVFLPHKKTYKPR